MGIYDSVSNFVINNIINHKVHKVNTQKSQRLSALCANLSALCGKINKGD